MERKRKLPARAAARSEQKAKRRTMTPESRSETPAPPPPPPVEPEPTPTPVPVEEPVPPLPTSIQAGKPLPTVEVPQAEDLPAKDYQLVSESGVLSESLTRSRRKWISEGIFEKFWSKPYKRKGVVVEEPNNPPKECMTRLGQVTITVEPHVFEATMFAVKDPKAAMPLHSTPNSARPVMQYGPPNGVMPPPPTAPPTPTPVAQSPVAGISNSDAGTPKPSPAPPATSEQTQSQAQQAQQAQQMQTPLPGGINRPQASISTPKPNLGPGPGMSPVASPHPTPGPAPAPSPGPLNGRSLSSPRGMESILSPSTVPAMPAPPVPPPTARPIAPSSVVAPPNMSAYPPGPPQQPQPGPPSTLPLARPQPPPPGMHAPAVVAGFSPGAFTTPAAPPVVNAAPPQPPVAKPAPGTDPIILTLAKRAGEDTELQELMKRVAQGDATKPELERFQAIIDEITAESKRKGTPGPSADRLLVDGKTVRYFADEVRAILDIVLASNPKQQSSTLRPPEGSDPLVVMLVKKTLDDAKTRDLVRRIAENRPQFNDAADLKSVLEALKREIIKENERRKSVQAPATPSFGSGSLAPKLNGTLNGQAGPGQQTVAAPQQLRSKGPPPVQIQTPVKPDISAVVFEFAGGNGDRYLFPKFSILEYVPVTTGQQVIASFIIVRKGSESEYPMADPALDYYQPVTIRLYIPNGRHLDNLSRVVAPKEEVQRYMDDVMDKMTRAEYVLLAMRLPRSDAVSNGADTGTATPSEEERNKMTKSGADKQAGGISFVNQTADGATDGVVPHPVLWTSKPRKPEIIELPPKSRTYAKDLDVMDTDEQYQSFISSVGRKHTEEV